MADKILEIAPRRGQTVECGPGTGMGLELEGANNLRLVECAAEREREGSF